MPTLVLLLLTFPVTTIVLAPVSLLLKGHGLGYLTEEHNIFNLMFADYGIIVFITLYTAISLLEIKYTETDVSFHAVLVRQTLKLAGYVAYAAGLYLFLILPIYRSTGFKISGHLFGLSLLLLTTVIELARVKGLPRDDSSSKIFKRITVAVLAVCAVWYLLFLITCVFFHTFPEKLLGLALGMVPPVVLCIKSPDLDFLSVFQIS
ncbi:hypothetical protein BABINDRAFT_121025 [Babjeviella inositovora NRRL Y-12698]|uniref:Uncharacterized protein n=1 Tax=Babjeviella inositovora NRRL Y-12698 TaxID=984486 RepID=A0A1E3QU15_9ASCO|nr:uncharacterized protein BABINDRAFT_121025 [Babjeviella inositovora NRRL Y-12698]ODQ81188.1 hypothetical protein BABINDRAFT_121025 [Babjeviella inositovora NRRL Y-12698]